MPKSATVQTFALPVVACVAAAGVGLWLGFSSCGGYVWHTYVGYSLVGLAMVVSAIAPAGPQGASSGRLVRAAAVLATFFVARGLGFALYLGASTPAEYFRHVGATFGSGLC